MRQHSAHHVNDAKIGFFNKMCHSLKFEQNRNRELEISAVQAHLSCLHISNRENKSGQNIPTLHSQFIFHNGWIWNN